MPLMLEGQLDTNMDNNMDNSMNGNMDTNMDADMDNGMAAPMQVDHLDVDDLFGDGVALALRNIRTPSKYLYQRVDELRTRGCCQYESSYPSPMQAVVECL